MIAHIYEILHCNQFTIASKATAWDTALEHWFIIIVSQSMTLLCRMKWLQWRLPQMCTISSNIHNMVAFTQNMRALISKLCIIFQRKSFAHVIAKHIEGRAYNFKIPINILRSPCINQWGILTRI